MRRALVLLLSAACAAREVAPREARALRPIPSDLAAAATRFQADPTDLDACIWYGRRLGYEGRFEDAVAVYGAGLERRSDDPELLRHRGHRFLSLRRFEAARADLERAAAAIEGQPDRVELDGAPNAFGVPTSTLHTNVWYHLGLAYHCLRRDEEAARVFAQCLALASNDDMRVAAAYWRVLALFHLGRSEDALALATHFARRELALFESFDYAALLRLFAGVDEDALATLAAADTPLSATTLGYGVAMWERMEQREDAARARLAALAAAGPSSAFGRLAAEVELERLGDS